MINRQTPLAWPANEPRTPPAQQRGSSPFQVTPDKALRDLEAELKKFKAHHVIMSLNTLFRGQIKDHAVALYFDLPPPPGHAIAGPRAIAICCDLYTQQSDNIRALFKVVEAMRTIERYGGTNMSAKTFTGFVALPPPPDIWKTLGVSKSVAEALNNRMRREFVMDAFRDQVKATHAAGGDMAALVEARDQALEQLGVK